MNELILLQKRENQQNPYVSEGVKLVVESQKQPKIQNSTLTEAIERTISGYLDAMQGQQVDDLYESLLSEIEAPLLNSVMKSTSNNQSLTAKILGLNRGTLRKKMKKYGML